MWRGRRACTSAPRAAKSRTQKSRPAIRYPRNLKADGKPIMPSDIARAVKLFAATPPVSLAEAVTDRAAVRNGSASIVLHGVSRPDIPQIIQTATEQGIKLYRVQPEEPSLEDVYFALQEL